MAEIKVKATFDGSAVRSGLNQLKSYGKEFSSSLAGGIAGGLGAAAIAGKLVDGFAQAMDKFAKIGDLSDRLGVDTTSLQRFGFAAEQSGLDLETAAKALQKIKLSMGDAVSGEKKATDGFAALGISLQELRNNSPEGILFKIADGLAKVGDENERLNVLTGILGNRLGGQLLPLLGQGSEELRNLMNQAATLSEADVRRIQQADDNLTAAKNNLIVGAGTIAGLFIKLADLPGRGIIKSQRADVRNFATDQFNAGMITKEQYDKQLDEINQTFDPRLAQYGDEEAIARIKERKDQAMKDLHSKQLAADKAKEAKAKKTEEEKAADEVKKKAETELAARVSAFVPVSSSLGAVGGGGGFYTGTDPALLAAQQTADATTRTADAVEKIAGQTPTDPTSVTE
jgi:hypothetical protein